MKTDISNQSPRQTYLVPETILCDGCLQYAILQDSGIASGEEDDWGVL